MKLPSEMAGLPAASITHPKLNGRGRNNSGKRRLLPRKAATVGRTRVAKRRAMRLSIGRRGIRKPKMYRARNTAVLNDELAILIIQGLAAAQRAGALGQVARAIERAPNSGVRVGGHAGGPQPAAAQGGGFPKRNGLGHRMALSFITGCTVSFLGRLAIKYLTS